MRLFSSFDILYFNSIYLVLFFFVIRLNKRFFFLSFKTITKIQLSSLISFFYSLKILNFNKFTLKLILIIILNLIILNFFSIYPFNFPFTSQFGIILFFSLSIWWRFIFFSLIKNFKGFFFHFIPQGAPIYLSFILFLIELISNLIRPVTLTVRLVANIISGHLLIILLSKLVFLFNPIFIIYIILNRVEIFVSFIQAYIFCTIIALYYSEI